MQNDAASSFVEHETESKERQVARLQLTAELNQLLRRLASYRNEGEWTAALNEATSRFAAESAVFSVEGGSLRLRAQNGLNLADKLSMPVRSAGAFAAAIKSKDPVVALRTPSEVGGPLSKASGGDRAHIFPIQNGSRLVAVLFAAGTDRIDVNGLELLAGVASLALQRPANSAIHTQIGPASAAGTGTAPSGEKQDGASGLAPRPFPSWARLSVDERDLHIRAQRFSRVKVAEMEISKPEACRAGRKENNFYLFLKREIDSARDSYRKQFMKTPHMSDYLHLELVRSSVGGDEQKLGADYPGPLD
jgi:hypothetical protein